MGPFYWDPEETMGRNPRKKKKIGIRREDKNKWERRTPITPEYVAQIARKHGIDVAVQPSGIRVFKDKDYGKSGAMIEEDLSGCDAVFGIKEIPAKLFRPGGTYLFFSHTIKGQKHNMPMLRAMMDLKCTLIDYEKITDRSGKRLIFFGKHAGLAGMIDTLWALGQRLRWEGIPSPFERMLPAHRYGSLEEAKSAVAKAGLELADGALPEKLSPFICGFAGYGNVSTGAQEIFDLLPVKVIRPGEIFAVIQDDRPPRDTLFKVVFREEDMASPADPKERFVLQDYYDHPEKYVSIFDRHVPHLTLLINGIYWDSRYPRLVTKELIRKLWRQHSQPRLRVIGDISCDVEGAIEATVKITTPDSPVFVYDPEKDSAADGWQGRGPVVLAVDNLPCELPLEASRYFSDALARFIPSIARENYALPFEQCALPEEIRKAVILWNGKLTPDYLHLSTFVNHTII
jgi:saccharopine dehydrogenase (NAD+, L-lysine-forming)